MDNVFFVSYSKDFGLLQFAYEIWCDVIKETFPDNCSVDIIETNPIKKGMAFDDVGNERLSPVRELIKMFEKMSKKKQYSAKPQHRTQRGWRQKKTEFVDEVTKIDKM